jgi:hypothetical protein
MVGAGSRANESYLQQRENRKRNRRKSRKTRKERADHFVRWFRYFRLFRFSLWLTGPRDLASIFFAGRAKLATPQPSRYNGKRYGRQPTAYLDR